MGGVLRKGCGVTSAHDGGRRVSEVHSNVIEQLNFAEHSSKSCMATLLLLGAGESGKSTLFKQIELIWGNGYTLEQRSSYISSIRRNVVECMRNLCRGSETLDLPVAKELQSHKQSILLMDVESPLTIDHVLVKKWDMLWDDSGIQAVYERRNEIQLLDNCVYLFSRLGDISQPEYLPSDEDILRCRVRTTGIVESCFQIGDSVLRIVDVGGQKSERKKWIRCFAGVTAVVYVVSLSSYDLLLYEDNETNRLDESLNLFDQISNNTWLKDKPIVLFLNKSDVLEEKLGSSPFSKYRPDFTGVDSDFDAIVDHVAELFMKRNGNPSRSIFQHITCATQTDNVQTVFRAVKEIVLKECLAINVL